MEYDVRRPDSDASSPRNGWIITVDGAREWGENGVSANFHQEDLGDSGESFYIVEEGDEGDIEFAVEQRTVLYDMTLSLARARRRVDTNYQS